ncbi:hypothetical protein [Streptomyces tubercidicus]|uniref:hypothetical protein n=1 Tax=Streptomyces tubercidicus TaxID=47759 RepID=UPI0034657346
MSSDPLATTTAAQGSGVGGATTRSGLFGDTSAIEDPQSLKKAGTGALGLAGELHTQSRVAEDSLHWPGQDLLGNDWGGDLGNAILQAEGRWAKQAAALVQTCRALHDQCTTTADNYTKTEAANTETMNAVSKTRSPFD